jgi:hypothetical protein
MRRSGDGDEEEKDDNEGHVGLIRGKYLSLSLSV